MKKALILSLLLILEIFPLSADTLKRGYSLRDAEIETVLKSYIGPLFQVAGLNPERLNLVLMSNPDVNAMATLDHTMVINTGLLMAADSAQEVIGVIAHETSHIADGHLLRGYEAMGDASTQMILGTALGGILAASTGSPDLFAATTLGGMQMAQEGLMSHSRSQEGSADQGGVAFLESLHWPSQGLLTFMEKLHKLYPMNAKDAPLYIRSHPLATDRIEALQHKISALKGGKLPSNFEDNFQRIKIKIQAFMQSPQDTLRNHKGSTLIDRYARTIAYLKSSQFSEALGEIDGLLKDHPKDYAFWDLKGQILFESGKANEAAQAYATAVSLQPKNALLRQLYAQALVESSDPGALEKAEQELLRATSDEPFSSFAWHLLAVVYGKTERTGLAALALAEQNLLEGKFDVSEKQAKRALHFLGEDAQKSQRAKDILADIKRVKDVRKELG